MTDKTFIVVFAILEILLLLFGYGYISSKTLDAQKEFDLYAFRKEELTRSTQQLELIIFDLNQTLQIEKAKEAKLVAELSSLGSAASVSNSGSAPTQLPKPTVPTTRAS